MTATKRPINSHKAYHAHIYFDEQTKDMAKPLCDQSASLFNLQVGRFHEKAIGPHPCWSCQVIFGARDFDAYIKWLDDNRQGLTILVHALSGNAYKDHTDYAYWLGDAVELNLDGFEKEE